MMHMRCSVHLKYNFKQRFMKYTPKSDTLNDSNPMFTALAMEMLETHFDAKGGGCMQM
jgi:hypothetical protein